MQLFFLKCLSKFKISKDNWIMIMVNKIAVIQCHAWTENYNKHEYLFFFSKVWFFSFVFVSNLDIDVYYNLSHPRSAPQPCDDHTLIMRSKSFFVVAHNCSKKRQFSSENSNSAQVGRYRIRKQTLWHKKSLVYILQLSI
jgi:hypothetical protein